MNDTMLKYRRNCINCWQWRPVA